MSQKHRILFILYLSVGILNTGLLLLIPIFNLDVSPYLFGLYVALALVWFANAYLHLKHSKQKADS